MKTRLFYLHALTPLHVGVGQAIGVVDLPIMRERSTQLPIVPGSTLKGVLRDEWRGVPQDSPWAAAGAAVDVLMGPDSVANNAHAGALAFGDARPLLLPVRSLAGVTAWTTCPFVLRRYARDALLAGQSTPPVPNADGALVPSSDTALAASLGGQRWIVLEDLELPLRYDAAARQWAEHLATVLGVLDDGWAGWLSQHLVVLPDDDFAFLAETATEVRARVRIDDATRVVQLGALWYEENLPAEAVLWGVLGVGPSRRKDQAVSMDEVGAWLPSNQPLAIQVGGKQTVGRGLCRWLLT